MAKGQKSLEWKQILETLTKAIGKKPQAGGSFIDALGSPLSNNFVSELAYSSCYRNLVQLINKYQSPSGNYQDASALAGTLKEFEKEYSENSLKIDNFKDKVSGGWTQCGLKWLFS